MLKGLNLNLELQLLHVDRITVGKQWNWQRVNSPFSRLYYIADGSAKIKLRNESFNLTPGNLYLIPCFEFHDYHCDNYLDHYFIHFTSRLHSGFDLLNIKKYAVQIEGGQNMERLFRRLLTLNPDRKLLSLDPQNATLRHLEKDKIEFEELISGGSTVGNKLSRIAESQGIMLQLLSPFMKTCQKDSASGDYNSIERLEQVLAYIDNNLDSQISLADIAKIAHLNPTYFSNVFSELMGERPIAYLNRKRIEKAQMLLVSTDLKLREIAFLTGFSDENYFSRVFSKNIGHPPNKYRYAQRQLGELTQ